MYPIVFTDDLQAFLAHLLTQGRITNQFVYIACQFITVAGLEDIAICTVMSQFGQGVGVGRDDSQATGHSFHSGKALQVSLRGYHEEIRAMAQGQQLSIAYKTQKRDTTI